MPREVFIAGQILTAAELNTVSDQTVMSFADSAARGSAIPTPVEGMTSYLDDLNRIEVYNGSAWGAIGTILQVVSTAKTDTFSVTNTNFTDVTNYNVTITPSSTSSKVLVVVHANTGNSTNNNTTMVQLYRDATLIAAGDTAGSRARVFGGPRYFDTNVMDTVSMTFLDSPATTSATTYKVAMASRGGATGYLNRSGLDTDSANLTRGVSTITLMEVAG